HQDRVALGFGNQLARRYGPGLQRLRRPDPVELRYAGHVERNHGAPTWLFINQIASLVAQSFEVNRVLRIGRSHLAVTGGRIYSGRITLREIASCPACSL